MPFQGFPTDTVGFLRELEANNRREWFEANKARYEELVLGPALAFIEAMGPLLDGISSHLTAIPKRTGGSLMRVYRDTRFSKDKRPYKTNIGLHFRHERAKDVHAPGFYVHVEPSGVFLALGVWHPERDALTRIRDHIVEFPANWRKARDRREFREVFQLGGDSLRRPPRGYDPEHPLIEDLKRKDFIGSAEVEPTRIHSPDFPIFCASRFAASREFMMFLCEALGAPF